MPLLGSRSENARSVVRMSDCDDDANNTLTLRMFLNTKANAVFLQEGVADVKVDRQEVDSSLSDMIIGVVAHRAINQGLSHIMAQTPSKLLDSIVLAEKERIISHKEARWLKHINDQANKAKHESVMPF